MSGHTSRGKAWNELRLQVLNRDGWRCVYCAREANEADHVVAKANGGQDELSNLVAACRTCNGTKADRTTVRLNYVNTRWLDSL